MRRSTGLAVVAGAVVLAGTAVTLGDADAAVSAAACPVGAPDNPLPAASVRADRVVGGFDFLEGPVWDATSGTLFMSDLHGATGPDQVQPADILAFTPPSTTVRRAVTNSGSNGLALSVDGRSLLAATHDRQSVSSFALPNLVRSGEDDDIADSFGGSPFNSPNDLTVRGDGTVYFTDPSFQRGRRTGEAGGRTGVFRVKDGVVSLVDDTIDQPNGVVLAPDGRTLYVGGNTAGIIFAYPVAADGSTGARRVFARIVAPDGATVDCAGNIYWASFRDGFVHVFTPAGRKLGTVSAGRHTTNAAFGGPDGKTLFVTSGDNEVSRSFGVFSTVLNLPGSPF